MPDWGLDKYIPRDVAKIVEEQVARWKLEHRARTDGRAPSWPVIALSRQTECNAEEIGKRVVRRLGFGYWDHQIVTAVAQTLRTDEYTVERLDEHVRGVIEDLISSALFGQWISEPDYSVMLRTVIQTIEQRGGAVIVGRGAHCIVTAEHALRVRVVCALEQRVANYRARSGASEQAALRHLRASDHEHAEFLRREFGQDASDSTRYDIVINTGIYDPSRAEQLVLMAYLAKFGVLPTEARDPV